MAKVVVEREMRMSSFGAYKWRADDHKRPLVIKLEAAVARIYLVEATWSKNDLIVFPQGRIELLFDPAPSNLIAGLKSSGAKSTEVAYTIYSAYREAHSKFESLLMSAANLKILLLMGPEGIHGFYEDSTISGHGVTYRIDEGESIRFLPKLAKPRGKHPMYMSKQLVTPARWQALQKAADDNKFPSSELLELYRIRNKASWQEIRVAAIEASIISESLLRAYGVEALKRSGFSSNKLKKLRDELSFNNLLNVVLPLSLTKSDLRKIQSSIDAVDRLRTIRNDLVHGNISEKDVDSASVMQGIEEGIKLVRFLRTKI